jgi:hypothetical protein
MGWCGRWPWMECRPYGDARPADDKGVNGQRGILSVVCILHMLNLLCVIVLLL